MYHEVVAAIGSDSAAFSLLLLFAFAAVLAGIRFGNYLIGTSSDPTFGRFSPMVPVLIPMAFIGELVYRMEFFAKGIGNFIPTFGRQFNIAILERAFFEIPGFPVQVLSAFLMLNSAIAGCYVLWRFCLEDFEGVIKLRNFICLNFLIATFLMAYITVIF